MSQSSILSSSPAASASASSSSTSTSTSTSTTSSSSSSTPAQPAKIIRECIHKLSQIIIRARIPQPHDHEEEISVANKWFNLQLMELGNIRNIVDSQIRPSLADSTINNPSSSSSIPTNHVLHIDIFVDHQSSAGSADGTNSSSRILLERWSINHEKNDPHLLSSSTSSSRRPTTAHDMYKRMTILVRSLFSYVRILPLYQLYKYSCGALGKGEDPGYTLDFTIIATSLSRSPSIPTPAQASFDSPPNNFIFSSIPTPDGKLHLSVFYRKDCAFDFTPSMTILPRQHHAHGSAGMNSNSGKNPKQGATIHQHIIQDYIPRHTTQETQEALQQVTDQMDRERGIRRHVTEDDMIRTRHDSTKDDKPSLKHTKSMPIDLSNSVTPRSYEQPPTYSPAGTPASFSPLITSTSSSMQPPSLQPTQPSPSSHATMNTIDHRSSRAHSSPIAIPDKRLTSSIHQFPQPQLSQRSHPISIPVSNSWKHSSRTGSLPSTPPDILTHSQSSSFYRASSIPTSTISSTHTPPRSSRHIIPVENTSNPLSSRSRIHSSTSSPDMISRQLQQQQPTILSSINNKVGSTPSHPIAIPRPSLTPGQQQSQGSLYGTPPFASSSIPSRYGSSSSSIALYPQPAFSPSPPSLNEILYTDRGDEGVRFATQRYSPNMTPPFGRGTSPHQPVNPHSASPSPYPSDAFSLNAAPLTESPIPPHRLIHDPHMDHDADFASDTHDDVDAALGTFISSLQRASPLHSFLVGDHVRKTTGKQLMEEIDRWIKMKPTSQQQPQPQPASQLTHSPSQTMTTPRRIG